jgi:hypothetical protein
LGKTEATPEKMCTNATAFPHVWPGVGCEDEDFQVSIVGVASSDVDTDLPRNEN